MEQDLGHQLAYQRGVQAVIWGMPAVSFASLRDATFRDLGARYNDIVYMSNVAEPRHELLTAGNQAPQVLAMLNLKGGPVVLDVPAASEKAVLAGSAVDGWMVPIADVGPAGKDGGKGDRFLFLPPGHQDPVPAGFIPAPSATYDVLVALRAIASARGTLAHAVAQARRLRAYPLAVEERSPANRYIDAYPKAWRTLPAYDTSYFEALARVIQSEPLQPKDAAMMGMLASIGIQKGMPFLPDGKLARALEQAVKDGRRQMEHYFETPGLALTAYRPGGCWMVYNSTPHDGGTYVVDGKLLLDERAGGHAYWTRAVLRRGGQDLYRLNALRDGSGRLLKGNRLYRLRVPAELPARGWSVNLYAKDSKAFVYNDLNRVGLSSRDSDRLRTNDDDTMDLYFGPRPPAGGESNWLPTAGRDFFLIFRLFGPEKAVLDRALKLPDIEEM